MPKNQSHTSAPPLGQPSSEAIQHVAQFLDGPMPVREFLTNIWVDSSQTAADAPQRADIVIQTGVQEFSFWLSPIQPPTYLARESNQWLGDVLRDETQIRAGLAALTLVGRSSLRSYRSSRGAIPGSVVTFPGGRSGMELWDKRQLDGTWRKRFQASSEIIRWVNDPNEETMQSEIARYYQPDGKQTLDRITQLVGLSLSAAVEVLGLPSLDAKDTGENVIVSRKDALTLASTSQAAGSWPTAA